MKTLFKIILASIFYFTFTASAFSQQSTFTSVFYDLNGEAQAYGIVQSFDSNYIVVGSRGYDDGLILKMGIDGNIIWDKRIVFGNYNSMLTRIIRTTDSCFVIVGNNNADMVVMKINANGDTLWTKSIDLGFVDFPVSVQQTFDEGFILGGYSYRNTSPYDTRMTVVKLDSTGNLSWATHITGGYSINKAYSIKQLPDSGYVVAGQISGVIPNYKASLIRLTSTGELSWSKKLEPTLPYDVSGYDVYVSDSSLVFYAKIGQFKSGLIKADLSGNVIWAKQIDVNPDEGEIFGQPGPTLHPTSDGGFVFVAFSGWFSEGVLFKVDSTGNVNWSQMMLLRTADVIEDFDNGYITIGNGPIFGVKTDAGNNPQIGIIKSDSLGNSIQCVGQNWPGYDTVTIGFVEDTVTVFTAETTISEMHPEITESGLELFSGCVTFLGAVDEEKSPVFTVFPNPTNGTFQIQTKQQENLSFQKLTVYNLEGKVVFESENPQLLQSEIELPLLPNGMYFAQLAFRENTYSVKFLIQH